MAKKHSARFLALVEESRKQVQEVTAAEVQEKLERGDSFQLIDVRESEEYGRGHLPGAGWLCKGILEREIEKTVPDVETAIVLYCGGGFRSVLAAESLQKMGYKNVASMAGGWSTWVESGYLTEK
jgi:rhodanese-related sulfurtransferase